MAQAAYSGQGSLPFSYSDFHGGLNLLQAPYLLTDDEARDLSNLQGTTAGAIVKRQGLVTLASPSNIFTSLFPLESTTTPFLIGTDASAIYSVKADGTVTSLKTGLSNKRWECVSGPVVSSQGPLFMMNGTDTPQQWNGTAGATSAWTATDSGGTVPNGTMCIYHQNQVFVSGVAANPSRLYWSGINDPTAWNPANLNGSGFEDFDPNDGAAITGLGTVGPYILVGKPRKLWVLVNPATAQTRQLSDNVGIGSHRSLAIGPEGTYFLAEDRGVFITNGSKVEAISDKIRPGLDQITSGARTNAAGTYFNGHYYLSVQQGNTANDTTFDYDATLGSWWKHSFAANQYAVWHPSGAGTRAQLYQAAADAAKVDQCFASNVYTDRGAAMTWVWRGPWQSPSFYRRRRFPTPYFKKRLRQVRAQGQGTVDFSLARDFAGYETLVRSNIFSSAGGGTFGGADGSVFGAADGTVFGASAVQLARIYGQGVADAFSLVFGSTSSSQDMVFMYMMSLVDRRDQIPA